MVYGLWLFNTMVLKVEIDETTDEDMCDDVETQSVQEQKGLRGLDRCRYLHFLF